jgi:hypothetical protein
MLPASLTPVAVFFPRFGLSVSKKNVHRSEIFPPKRMRKRRRKRLVDVPVLSGVSISSSWGCARKPNLMLVFPSFDSICHWALAPPGHARTQASTPAATTVTLMRCMCSFLRYSAPMPR